MLRAHRQAWAWQDEWVGLTIEDIRKLEAETQLILQQKLGRIPTTVTTGEGREMEGREMELVTGKLKLLVLYTRYRTGFGHQLLNHSLAGSEGVRVEEQLVSEGVEGEEGRVVSEGVRVVDEKGQVVGEGVEGEAVRVKVEHTNLRAQSAGEGRGGSRLWERRRSSRTLKHGRSSVRSVRTEGEGVESLQPPHDSDNESMYSFRAECGLDQIALLSEGEADLEFFDAKGKAVAD